MLDLNTADRLASLALGCVHREYPNKVGHHVLNSGADVRPPRELTPAFYGCFDWHSAVHGHWMLARLARWFPGTALAVRAKQALGKSLTAKNLRREAEYMDSPARSGFERPYGLAWLLQLAAELSEWDDTDARNWSSAMEPLVQVAVKHLETWLPKLSNPVRSGEHSQSAFSLGLLFDSAALRSLVEAKIRSFYLADRDAPLAYEPSGEDFLSPSIAEADVVRRVLSRQEFAEWLEGFLPAIPRDGGLWMEPAQSADPSDGKLAHLDGLNLSRAWMLNGIEAALPGGDSRIPSLKKTAERHAVAGLAAVTDEHYAGAHWLGTFAVYLLTGRGLQTPR